AEHRHCLVGGRAPGLERTVCVVCGPGNNGGDGFAAARLLHNQGTSVTVFLLGRAGELKNEARINFQRFRKLGLKVGEVAGGPVRRSPPVADAGGKGVAALTKALSSASLIIDAVFGTGFKGAPDKNTAEAVSAMNASGVPILAVDIPSGINGETGTAGGAAVRAQRTVTLGLAKTGLFFHPGKTHAGETIIADIGFPEKLIDEHICAVETVEPAQAAALLPVRKPDAHKGSCGTVFALAGSLGFTGAAALTAQAALRSGAGLVYLGVPESLHDVMAVKLTEVITKPLPETRTRTVSIHALDRIRALIAKADALAIGPGLSTHPETVELVQQLMPLLPVPAVIDADGINALSQKIDILGTVKVPLILTPHYGEMSRLLQFDILEVKNNPLAVAREAARRFKQVIVLKGAPTVAAEPSGKVWINTTGNAGMATAGAGDVLTGLIAGLLAQGLKPAGAARLGVYLHGLCGDIAVENKTEFCLLAGDLIEFLPDAFKRLLEDSR
ncbi:MAG: NAD(P)H-hydrate dehydratase, partial [Candidatus Edwardsbacteria bacterium]|nr:NAD(P)H-hydrate dehydratase [Candidatus Edwardsbacteria bacterium]